MSEPFLNLGDVGSVVEGVGGGGRAQRVRSQEFHEDAELLGAVHDNVAIDGSGQEPNGLLISSATETSEE